MTTSGRRSAPNKLATPVASATSPAAVPYEAIFVRRPTSPSPGRAE